MSTDTSRRLSSPGIERATSELTFTFEGERITAYEGDTLASALTAAGRLGLRDSHDGERRGLFCGMGACQDCLVEVDGRGSQRACMTKATDGMDVRRGTSSAARLVPLAARPDGDIAIEVVDVAIVGAGPAGLAAAPLLAAAGLTTLILDERDAPGGQYFKLLAPSHRFRDAPVDSQFAAGDRHRAAAVAAGARVRPASLVWKASAMPDATIELSVITANRHGVIRARALLIAAGAYEAPHHVPGWTLPGVMTAGAAQTLARSYRVSPGQRVLVAGNGPLNWQVALELARGGANVVALVESARPSVPDRLPALAGMMVAAPALTLQGLGMRAALWRERVPVLEGQVVSAISGRTQVEQVETIDPKGTRRVFEVDVVTLGYGFIPAADLIRHVGGRVTVDAARGFAVPVTDANGWTSVPNVWAAGDGAGIRGSQAATARGELAAADILAKLGYSVPDTASARQRLRVAQAFQTQLWRLFSPRVSPPPPSSETTICRCENVTLGDIDAARADGIVDLGSLKRRTRLGMGRCQGRYCAGAALRRLRDTLEDVTEADLFAPQAPVRPVPAVVLALEKQEWGGHREVPVETTPRGAHRADPLPRSCDVLVVGAGVTGLSTAMFAAQDGMDVLVVDCDAPNSQASGSNAGSLHVQLLSWDFGKKAMAGGSPAQRTLPLQRDSVALWKELERDLHANFEIDTTGGLMVAEDEAQAVFLRLKAEAEQAAGIDTVVIGRNELASLAPAISERMAVAAYCAAEGKINPLKATPVIGAAAVRAGARVLAGHRIVGIEPSGDRYVVHSATGATVVARRIVIAAGGWSRNIGRLLGHELPISGAPLQMLVTEPVRPMLKQLVAHADRHLTMKQATNGNLIIGGAWTASADPATGYSKVLRESIEGNLWVAERTVPAVAGLHLLRSWAAMNINIDGAPLLGGLPGHKGVFIAATANGYTLGPMMGRITAALVAGRDPGRAIDYFTLDRFN